MNRRTVQTSVAWALASALVCLPAVLYAANSIVPDCGADGCSWTDLVQLVNNVIDFLIKFIAVPISGLLFAWAGFLFLTAAGNSGQIEKAKGIFFNVLVGLIIALASWLIVNLVTTALTNQNVNFFLG
jgi:hypothetical protein